MQELSILIGANLLLTLVYCGYEISASEEGKAGTVAHTEIYQETLPKAGSSAEFVHGKQLIEPRPPKADMQNKQWLIEENK